MAKHSKRRSAARTETRRQTVLTVAGVELSRPQVYAFTGLLAVGSFVGLTTTLGSIDSALASSEVAAQPLLSTTSSSTPLAAEWFDQQATTTSLAGPPATTLTPVPPPTTTAPPPTTSTTADPMAGFARYDVHVGSFAGAAFRLSDVEPGRKGVALLACSCHPEETLVGDEVSIDGRSWQVSRVGVAATGDLHVLLDGAPVVPVVRIVSSLEGATHQWIEVR